MRLYSSLCYLLLIVFNLVFVLQSQATHLRGGYITYKVSDQNPLSLNFEMIIFRDVTGVRPEDPVTIDTGLGTLTAPLTSATPIGDYTDKLTYSWRYEYPTNGTYTVSWNGVNRNNNILNLLAPSEQHSMLIQTTIFVSAQSPTKNGINYLNPSFTFAYVGVPLKYNLQAYNQDGDSLTYALVPPFRKNHYTREADPIPGFTIPVGMTINSFGEINWSKPLFRSEFAFVVEVKSYRNKKLVSISRNDLQIKVLEESEFSDFSLTNLDQLIKTQSGSILARPGVPVKLLFFAEHPKYPNTAKVVTFAPVTELQETHLNDLSAIIVTERDSSDRFSVIGRVTEIIFTPDISLIRSQPYTLSVRHQLNSTTRNLPLFKREFVYLTVTDRLTTTASDLLPELAHLLYPNPAGNHFMLEAPAASSAIFRLYALDGRLVQELALQPGKNRVERPSGLSTGLYTYSISSEGYRSRTGKLLLR